MKLSEWILCETYVTAQILKYPLGVAAILAVIVWVGGWASWVWPVALGSMALLAWTAEWLAIFALAVFSDD